MYLDLLPIASLLIAFWIKPDVRYEMSLKNIAIFVDSFLVQTYCLQTYMIYIYNNNNNKLML